MGLYINTNLASLVAQNNLNKNTSAVNKNLQQLSSGLRINNASDDAAGLQIANKLTAQINGVNQASSNAQDGINLLSVAEGTLSTINDNLQRIRELAVQAANDTNGSTQRSAIQSEITQRINGIAQLSKSTQFNGINLLTTSVSSLNIQIGANSTTSLNSLNIATSALGSATATGLGISVSLGTTSSSARVFLSKVDNALTAIGNRLAKIGALQNRLSSVVSNLATTSQNYSAAQSRIQDVDIASATASLSQNQILQQAAASILTQANQAPQIALKLIQG